MKKINSDIDFIKHIDKFNNKTVIDVGCGTGNLVRWFASQDANITGIDIEPMLSKAQAEPLYSNEKYLNGVGQELPFINNFADFIFYAASFHHIPTDKMLTGIEECKRVLKQGGKAVFIEPVSEKYSYYELIKLLADEKEIQLKTIETLKNAINEDFLALDEKYYYFERSLNDYKNLLEVFEENLSIRNDCFEQAIALTEKFAQIYNTTPENFRYKSLIRVNIFQKN